MKKVIFFNIIYEHLIKKTQESLYRLELNDTTGFWLL
jgi:hypothetical protein